MCARPDSEASTPTTDTDTATDTTTTTATDTTPRRHREREHGVLARDRDLVTVRCPHADCERTGTTALPNADVKIRVSRRSAFLGDYEELRCSDGHRVFVHYCESQ